MDILSRQVELRNSGKTYAVMTVAAREGNSPYTVGKKMILDMDGNAYGTVGGGSLEKRIMDDAAEALSRGESRLAEYEHICDGEDEGLGCEFRATIFIEVMKPLPTLVVCGGGHVGGEVVNLARHVGFRTILIDGRSRSQLDGVGPDEYIHSDDFEQALLALQLPDTAFFLCSAPAHTLDKAALKGALQKPFGYVGMLGSKKKTESMFPQLMAEGIKPELLQQVHCPVGLNVANSDPKEIAVGIVAEMLMYKNGKKA